MSCECCNGLNKDFLKLMQDIQDGKVNIKEVDLTSCEPFYSIFAHIYNKQFHHKKMGIAIRDNNFMKTIVTV